MLLGVPLIVQLILVAKVAARGGLSATNQVGHSARFAKPLVSSCRQPPSPKLSYGFRTTPDSAIIPDAALGGWHRKRYTA